MSSLFPRPDLSDPQRLLDDRGHPGFIYFTPEPETQVADRAWVFNGSGDRGVLLESRLPFKGISLQLENRSPRSTLQLEVFAFDQGQGRRELPPGGADQVDLRPPSCKKARNRYYYQLHLQAKVPAGLPAPVWLLRVNPR